MADNDMSRGEARQRLSWGAGIAIGMGIGVAMGSVFENMAIGIAIGVAVGVLFAIVFGAAGRRKPRQGQGDPDADEPGPDGPPSVR
ncbi:MAG: hypothetical protein ACTIKQ_07890 [Microbacterium sp.]|uniref:hypothetical protein n=1 Tax=Microbacterium sp. TaxID=51671 RepID=UPI003F99B192